MTHWANYNCWTVAEEERMSIIGAFEIGLHLRAKSQSAALAYATPRLDPNRPERVRCLREPGGRESLERSTNGDALRAGSSAGGAALERDDG